MNLIFKIISDRNLRLLQIKNINKIPCLFDDEIKHLLNKFYILHEYIVDNNPIYDFAKFVLDKDRNKNYFTDNLVKYNELNQNKKEIIVKKIISIFDKYCKNNLNKDEFSIFLNNYLILSENILLNQDISSYNDIINDIEEQINSYQEIVPYLYIYSAPKEINFSNFETKLKDILSNIQLEKKDKDALYNIALLIPKYCEEYKYIQDFKFIGSKFGEEFNKFPNYENLSKLIAIISLGVAKILNISFTLFNSMFIGKLIFIALYR